MTWSSYMRYSSTVWSWRNICENSRCGDYLRTRSEPWLDLVPSQVWCFSWALASFSAAAIGQPDKLKEQRDM